MRISDWSSDVCSADLQELIGDYQEYFEMGLTETWLCEMMNMPGFTKNGFRPDAVYYRPTPLQDEAEACFLCLDPAFGEEAVNDESAITVHMIQEDGPQIGRGSCRERVCRSV